MKANYEDKIPKPEAQVTLGTLYDVNKQIVAQEPEISVEKMVEAQKSLYNWIFASKHNYYMLLCHELRDYTLFNLDATSEKRTNKATEAAGNILECMTNRGQLISVEFQSDGAYELWLRNDEGCFAYYLFPYDNAVLEY